MSPALSPAAQLACAAHNPCLECERLQVERREWIQRYMDLTARRKLSLLAGKLPVRELTEELAGAEAELRELSRRLREHSSVHSAVLAAASAP